MKTSKLALATLRIGLTLALTFLLVAPAAAVSVLGTGTASLPGNASGLDLTDLNNDGVEGSYAPPNLGGFDAEFFSSDEPGFGGGEFAFNVFDNVLSGGNGKWCCGTSFPQIVGANLSNTLATGGQAIQLTSFTVSSANDVPGRDPQIWSIQGSNDTTTGLDGTWTTIYDHPNAASDWAARLQVNRYSPADGDTFQSSDAFTAFRMVTDQTGQTGGAFFQIGEIELFGDVVTPGPAVPEPSAVLLAVLGLGGLGLSGWRRRRK